MIPTDEPSSLLLCVSADAVTALDIDAVLLLLVDTTVGVVVVASLVVAIEVVGATVGVSLIDPIEVVGVTVVESLVDTVVGVKNKFF